MKVMTTIFPGLLAGPLLNCTTAPCHTQESMYFNPELLPFVRGGSGWGRSLRCRQAGLPPLHPLLTKEGKHSNYFAKLHDLFDNLLTRTAQYAYPLAQLANLAFPISMMAATLATTGVPPLPETLTAGANFFVTGPVEESDVTSGLIDPTKEFHNTVMEAQKKAIDILRPQLDEGFDKVNAGTPFVKTSMFEKALKQANPCQLEQLKTALSFLLEPDTIEIFRRSLSSFEQDFAEMLIPTFANDLPPILNTIRQKDIEGAKRALASLETTLREMHNRNWMLDQIFFITNFYLLRVAETTGAQILPSIKDWEDILDYAGGLTHDTSSIIRNLWDAITYSKRFAADPAAGIDPEKFFSQWSNFSTPLNIGLLAKKINFSTAKKYSVETGVKKPDIDLPIIPYSMRTDFFRIVYELMRNAIKNSDSGKPERWTNVRFEMSGTILRTFVEDNGVGIADKDAVWKRGVRLSPELAEGTGMGLPTARELTRKHGWKLALHKTELGVGSTFMLEMDTSGWK